MGGGSPTTSRSNHLRQSGYISVKWWVLRAIILECMCWHLYSVQSQSFPSHSIPTNMSRSPALFKFIFYSLPVKIASSQVQSPLGYTTAELQSIPNTALRLHAGPQTPWELQSYSCSLHILCLAYSRPGRTWMTDLTSPHHRGQSTVVPKCWFLVSAASPSHTYTISPAYHRRMTCMVDYSLFTPPYPYWC